MKLRPLLFSTLFITHCTTVIAIEQTLDTRQDEVARLGQQVMPFNLDQTLHIFSKTETGGLQQVIVKEPTNHAQITLIREHLKKIAEEFKQGNFSDPTQIHGKDMPGLTTLKNAAPGTIKIQYRELADGAEITYTTDNSILISAIHQWFDAQLNDHAKHATMHRAHHMQHNK
jgi:hypothetical protein